MSDLVATRRELQRVAVHLLARRRHAATGRFGLRATPGGFGTPAFGPARDVEVLRVDGVTLVHEVGGEARHLPLPGATLAALAVEVGVDLDEPFSVGHDTPPLGDATAPLTIDPAAAAALGEWFDLGWRALDAASAGDGAATVQLWPEHFDAATSVPVGAGTEDRANLGASAGDDLLAEPYLFVGPWGTDRPGPPSYWNVPFGAVLPRREVGSIDDAVAFLRQGLALLRRGAP